MLFLLFCLTSLVFGHQVQVDCPSYCECDLFLNYNRATCVKKTLINFDLYLPDITEILDVSFNQISHLDDNIFIENHLNLKLLNISHNKIGYISLYAFEGLNNLKVLDLSYNVVQYILPQWFYSLKSLEFLYLRGNNLGETTSLTKNCFSSKTLKFLDISKCLISFLSPAIFNLPNLEELDISENFLISLNRKLISSLGNLKILKASNNTFSCYKNMLSFGTLVKKRLIKYDDPCKQKQFPKKMEKMIMEIKDDKPKNIWFTEKVIKDENNVSCKINNIDETRDGLILTLVKINPEVFYILTLLQGLILGLSVGCIVNLCKIRKQNIIGEPIKNVGIKNIKMKNIRMLDSDRNILLFNENVGSSTPVLSRK